MSFWTCTVVCAVCNHSWKPAFTADQQYVVCPSCEFPNTSPGPPLPDYELPEDHKRPKDEWEPDDENWWKKQGDGSP
jgi:hypothetical protein